MIWIEVITLSLIYIFVAYFAYFSNQSKLDKQHDYLHLSKAYLYLSIIGSATYELANRFTDLKNCVSAKASKGSMFLSYGLAALNVANAIISIFADDPMQRATSRGYTLK